MPELPDVEILRRRLAANALHRRIEHVHVDQPQILAGTNAQQLGRRLQGSCLTRTRRLGKNLFAMLDDDAAALHLHFGMTGWLAFPKDDEDPPDHAAVTIDLDGGKQVVYCTERKLGKVEIVDDVDEWADAHELGPDALALSRQQFAELLRARRGMIKSSLMDQSVLAGIGNVYSDEILFQAGLHPRIEADSIDSASRNRLYDALRSVLEGAIEAHADPEEVPTNWLLPHREDDSCPRCGGPIRRIDVAGRSARYCPRCQAAPD